MDTRLGKTGLSVMALICLIRCGSSDASTTTSSRADLAATQAIELSGMNNSDPALLPVMGQPVYAGYATLDIPGLGAQIGDLDLAVTFGTTQGTVSGEIGQFDDRDGSLSIGGGRLLRGADPRTGVAFGADLDGTLTDASGDWHIDGEINGDFRGRDHDGITAVVSGAVDHDDQQNILDGSVTGVRTD